jgi:hypothetical protein
MKAAPVGPSLRAQRSNPSLEDNERMDCFVASLLAMTRRESGLQTDLPDGQISDGSCFGLSSPVCKNISVFPNPKSELHDSGPPTKGRIAIVTDAGWDAVDADAPLTNGVEADGEGVWS